MDKPSWAYSGDGPDMAGYLEWAYIGEGPDMAGYLEWRPGSSEYCTEKLTLEENKQKYLILRVVLAFHSTPYF